MMWSFFAGNADTIMIAGSSFGFGVWFGWKVKSAIVWLKRKK